MPRIADRADTTFPRLVVEFTGTDTFNEGIVLRTSQLPNPKVPAVEKSPPALASADDQGFR
jgi:hypothetical protein